MKINQSKNRRMFIMEQISLRQHSRQQSKKSSVERRRKVQESLTDFMKTMSDVSYGKTGGSQAFKFDQSSSRQNYYSQLSPQGKQMRRQYDEVLRSPSFKDIKILDEQQVQIQQKIEENVSILPQQSMQQKQKHLKVQEQKEQKRIEQQNEKQIEDEQIVYKEGVKQNNGVTPKSIMENQSSASAIFFTSQFNEFINKNHTQQNNSQQQLEKQQKYQHNQEQLSQKQQAKHQSQQQNQNQQQPIAQVQSQKQPIKQYEHEKQHSPQKPINQQSPEKQQNLLLQNKSNHSLAFSNQSSLKYSLNESNIKEIIHSKFTSHNNQFITHNNQFDLHNQHTSLLHHLKFQILVDKLHAFSYQNTHKQFCNFFKLSYFQKKIIKRQKTTAFSAFLINQELNLLDKKNQIKSQKFLQQKQQNKLNQIFQSLKQITHQLPLKKLQKAEQFYSSKQNQKIQRIFRCLKIAWFDQKVKKQIQLYYLSKLFSHFIRVIKKQKQIERKKYLSFYCFNLKKRFFNFLKQGVENLQIQRIQRDNATCHYSFGLMRKVFDAWKDRLSYKDRYISLAMTTKNTFKQTSDQRWMQIKTVDFRQIK